MRESDQPIPNIIRATATPFGRRHVKGIAVVRVLVAIWLVVLGCVFLATGHWWGVLLFVAAAAVLALAYLIFYWRGGLSA